MSPSQPRSVRALLAVLAITAFPWLAGAQEPMAEERAVQALADRIDAHVSAGWKRAKVKPAEPCSDADFLRRIYLDLAGRIPSVTEARKFLDDKQPDKRRRLVNRLLDGPRYAMHFGTQWRTWWLPETTANAELQFLGADFEIWLRDRLAKNTRYDEVVREILTLSITGDYNVYYYANMGTNNAPTPAAYYQARGNKAEELAASVGRGFLGLKLDCAQCHDHPFADWRREQFWGIAAFFAGLPRRPEPMESPQPAQQVGENFDRRELTIPGTEKIIKAAFLDKTPPKWKAKTSPRVTLAEWVTARENPYFARAAVNRLWAYFLGTGLIEPVDEIAGGQNLASHPELLAELARQFTEHHYDLKFVIRAITTSRTYQLSSAGKEPVEPQHFARMPLRGLTAEQLWDSLAKATGFDAPRGEWSSPNPVAAATLRRTEFLAKFARGTDKPTEYQTSILQALTLMNGKLVAHATSLERSETLSAVADSPFMNTAARIEALFLAALSRYPSALERERMGRYVEGRGSRALADVFWVLLNSSEFVLNH